MTRPRQVSTSTVIGKEIGAGENVHVPSNRVPPGGGFAPLRHRGFHAGAGYCRQSGRTPDVPGWPMLLQSGHNPSRSSREPSEPPDPRSLDWCAKSWRHQARMVSGLARRATGCRTLRPKHLPISARVARSPSKSRQPGCRRPFKMRFSAARYSFSSRSCCG